MPPFGPDDETRNQTLAGEVRDRQRAGERNAARGAAPGALKRQEVLLGLVGLALLGLMLLAALVWGRGG